MALAQPHNSLRFPERFDVAIGAAVTVQIGATAIGLTVDEAWALPLLVGGVVLVGVVSAVQSSRPASGLASPRCGWPSSSPWSSRPWSCSSSTAETPPAAGHEG
jgi:hypothetical protein